MATPDSEIANAISETLKRHLSAIKTNWEVLPGFKWVESGAERDLDTGGVQILLKFLGESSAGSEDSCSSSDRVLAIRLRMPYWRSIVAGELKRQLHTSEAQPEGEKVDSILCDLIFHLDALIFIAGGMFWELVKSGE
jgi:riboflavin synthase